MGSTVRSLTQQLETAPSPPATIRWRNWPLVDNLRRSWIIPAGVLCIGAMVSWVAGDWLAALIAVAALALVVWQYLLPITYEICSLGIRRYAFGRMRLVP